MWANEHLRPSDRIEAMSPESAFTTGLPDLEHAHLAGVAAASGVTPMMALAASVLASSPTARFTLVYRIGRPRM